MIWIKEEENMMTYVKDHSLEICKVKYIAINDFLLSKERKKICYETISQSTNCHVSCTTYRKIINLCKS